MELIYVQTRLKGQGSPELALLERKKESVIFINSWFRHTQLFLLMLLVLIDRKSAGDYDCEVRNLERLPALRYLVFCNVLHICNVQAIPTYRVYRLYDNIILRFRVIN